MGTSLKSHNVVVDGHRTSMRLEPEMWDALRDISLRENLSINQLCTLVNRVRDRSSLTSAVRVFTLAYFRSVAAGQDEPALELQPPAASQPPHPLDAALGLTRQQIAAERTQRPV
jgi:predicted DNA-binding ribbon-helix-helix protein